MAGIIRFKALELPFPVRLGVISDTHATSLSPALEEEVPIYFQGVTWVLHMGDVTHPSVLNDLEALGYRLIAVQGNNDRLFNHPHVILLRCGPYNIGMVHGSGGGYKYVEQRALRHIQSVTKEPLDAVLYGHTHVARCARSQGLWWFNPGALGYPRRDPTGTYPLLPSLATLEITPEGLDFQLFHMEDLL